MQLKLSKILLSCLLVMLSTGCATQSSKDPLEPINRGVYKFNDVTDKVLLKPVATAYKAVTPSPVRKGVSNFFSNLGSIRSVLNNLLQLKFANAFSEAGRFVINSTFGVAGFIDVAGMDNVERHQEDFGQTLGHWGVGNGAYLVLPLIGPSTLRDTTGFIVDGTTSDPITYAHNIGEIRLHNQLRAAQILDQRTQLLDASDILGDASLDPYAFLRDAYLQRRASQVQDGLVPIDMLDGAFDDGGFEPADEDVATSAAEDTSVADDTSAVIDVPEADYVPLADFIPAA